MLRGFGTIRTFRLQLPVFLLAFFSTPLCATENVYQTLTTEGIQLAYNLHFDEASNIFNQLIELEPENPHGYLLQCVSLYYRSQLEENHNALADEFKQYANQAIERAKKFVSNRGSQTDALFYLGTAHIYLAAYHGWEGEWLRAYWYGKTGIDYLERVVKLDSAYYDAYLGLGLYHYYTDIIPDVAKAVTFVLGIDNDREKGLAELALAAERGKYSKAEALLFLGSINLYIEKDYNQAESFFRRLTELYPENASFLMLLGENYQKLGHHKKAIATLEKLVDEKSAPTYPTLVIGSYFRLGNIYFHLRQIPKAIYYYEQSLAHASKSNSNVRWVFALANLNIGRSYDIIGRRREAISYYRRVKKSDHSHAYKLAQKRIKTPLPKKHQLRPEQMSSEIVNIYKEDEDTPHDN